MKLLVQQLQKSINFANALTAIAYENISYLQINK